MTKSTDSFINEFWKITQGNPFNDRERVLHWTGITLYPVSNEIHLSDIRALQPKQGNATKALTVLKRLADKHGVTISGTAKAYSKDKNFITKTADLKKWYAKNGFAVRGDVVSYKPKIQEKLEATDDVVTWIRHFRKSKNKMFDKDDRKQRWRRAVAAWMNAKEKAGLNETLDSSIDYYMKEQGRRGSHITPFGFTIRGLKYTVEITKIGDAAIRVDFHEGGTGNEQEGTTGKAGKSAFAVFGTVQKIVDDYLSRNQKIQMVSFEGNRDRFTVYDQLATKVAKARGWKIHTKRVGGTTIWYLIHPENPLLNEEFYTAFKPKYSRDPKAQPVEIFKNPTRKELQSVVEYDECRAWIDDTNLYVWNTFGGLHFEVKDHIKGFNKNKFVSLVLYPDNRKVDAVVTDGTRNSKWHHNPNVAGYVRSNRALKRLFSEIEVSYWDDDIVGPWDEIDEEMVTELFDKGIAARKTRSSAPWQNGFKFKTKSGKEFEIQFTETSSSRKDMIELSFADSDGNLDKTGLVGGEAISVFSTVVNTAVKYIKKNPYINTLSFSSFDGEVGRRRIYARMADEIAKKLKWVRHKEWEEGPDEFWIVKPSYLDESLNEGKIDLKKIANNKWKSPKGGFVVVQNTNKTFSVFRKGKEVSKNHKSIGAARKVVSTKLRNLKEGAAWNHEYNPELLPSKPYKRKDDSIFTIAKTVLSGFSRNNEKMYAKAMVNYKKLVQKDNGRSTFLSLAGKVAQTYHIDPRKFYAYLVSQHKKGNLEDRYIIGEEMMTEGRDSPLYHATDDSTFERILKSNQLQARTLHDKKKLNLDMKYGDKYSSVISGTSLTRSKKFADKWGFVIFHIDQRKLAQRHKIVPIDFFQNMPNTRRGGPLGAQVTEAEEFVIGTVKNLKNYLIGFSVSIDKYRNLFETGFMPETPLIEFLKGFKIASKKYGVKLLNVKEVDELIEKIKGSSKRNLRRDLLNLEEMPLDEGRDASLYHATPYVREILRTDKLKAITAQLKVDLGMASKKEGRDAGWLMGTSLTRSASFAANWRKAKEISYVIEFDQRKLAQRYKIVPIDYWGGSKGPGERLYTFEAEEFIVGNVDNIKKYIKAIHIGKYVSLADKDRIAELSGDIPLYQADNQLSKKIPIGDLKVTEETMLDEGRDAPLYHATTLKNFEGIMQADRILNKTKQYYNLVRPWEKMNAYSKPPVTGVSLTRSLRFAKGWDQITLVLDQRSLSHNHKFIPIDYFQNSDEKRSSGDWGNNEAEEFVVGTIKNVKKHLKGIYINVNSKFPKLSVLYYESDMLYIRDTVNKILEYAKKNSVKVMNLPEVLKYIKELEKEMKKIVNEEMDSFVYYASNIAFGASLLDDNEIKGKSQGRGSFSNTHGVLMTNSFPEAKRSIKSSGVILKLDGKKLQLNRSVGNRNGEYEFGTISNLKKYIVSVYLGVEDWKSAYQISYYKKVYNYCLKNRIKIENQKEVERFIQKIELKKEQIERYFNDI